MQNLLLFLITMSFSLNAMEQHEIETSQKKLPYQPLSLKDLCMIKILQQKQSNGNNNLDILPQDLKHDFNNLEQSGLGHLWAQKFIKNDDRIITGGNRSSFAFFSPISNQFSGGLWASSKNHENAIAMIESAQQEKEFFDRYLAQLKNHALLGTWYRSFRDAYVIHDILVREALDKIDLDYQLLTIDALLCLRHINTQCKTNQRKTKISEIAELYEKNLNLNAPYINQLVRIVEDTTQKQKIYTFFNTDFSKKTKDSFLEWVTD